MPRHSCSSNSAIFYHPSDHTDCNSYYRSVPTQDQVLVPETLLKKRKSQEKARAERNSAIEKRKAVSQAFSPLKHNFFFLVMINTTLRG